MGNFLSKKNDDFNLIFLSQLLGDPRAFVDEDQKVYIWNQKKYQKKTLFGNPVCFDRILLKETKDITKMCGSIKIILTTGLQKNLIDLNDFLIYDRNGILYCCGNSLDEVIILAKFTTDFLLKKNITPDMINQAFANISIDQTKIFYLALLDNLKKLNAPSQSTTEKFDPYFYENPRISNMPLDIADVEDQNKLDYDILDSSLMKKTSNNVEKFDPYFYGNGYVSNDPLNLNLTEDQTKLDYNILDKAILNRKSKMEKMQASPKCKGACLDRFNTIKNKTNVENFNPLFVEANALIWYPKDSDFNTVDRSYGTVSQQIQYPTIANLFTRGYG